MTRLINPNRGFNRQKIGAGELTNRIALGKHLLGIRHRYTSRDWSSYLAQMGWEPEFAQKTMRVARRFGDSPRMEKLLKIGLPFSIIEELSSPQIPNEIVDEFLSIMENTTPRTENCRKILRDLQPKNAEIQQSLLLESDELSPDDQAGEEERETEPIGQPSLEGQELDDAITSCPSDFLQRHMQKLIEYHHMMEEYHRKAANLLQEA